MAGPRMIKESVLKPIETRYKGHRFRSRTEARWAVLFDHLGVKYEYEPEGYELEDGTRYLPDFYMPNEDCFFEIKGQPPTDTDWAKAGGLAYATQKFVNILSGAPGKHRLDFARPKRRPSADLLTWIDMCPDETAARIMAQQLDVFAMPPGWQSYAVSRGLFPNEFQKHASHEWGTIYDVDFDDTSGRLAIWKTHWMPGYDAEGREHSHYRQASIAQVIGLTDGFLGWFDEVRFSPAMYEAIGAAKSARFEFGENGAG